MNIEAIRSLRGRKINILGHENTRIYAVLLPLVKCQNELCVLFEKRALNMSAQPGEICFPGGGVERKDNNLLATALRETEEEIGATKDNLEIIAPLDVLVMPFNAIIYPFLGYINDCSRLKPNPDEVEKCLFIPLQELLKQEPLEKKMSMEPIMPADYPYHLIPNGEEYPFKKGTMSHHFFVWEQEVIWGLTASILIHFLNLVRKL